MLFETSCPIRFALSRHAGSRVSFSWQREHFALPVFACASSADSVGAAISLSLGLDSWGAPEKTPQAAPAIDASTRATVSSMRRIARSDLIARPNGKEHR